MMALKLMNDHLNEYDTQYQSFCYIKLIIKYERPFVKHVIVQASSFRGLKDIKGKSLRIIVRSKNTSSIVGWSEKVFDNFYKR